MGNTVLREAVSLQSPSGSLQSLSAPPSIIRALIAAGADVNASEGGDGNALQAAVFTEQAEIVSILMKAGADTNASSSRWRNALETALEAKGDRDIRLLRNLRRIFELLIRAGDVDVNEIDPEWAAALEAAKGKKWLYYEMVLRGGPPHPRKSLK
jgi:ankyrin repeat protein